MTFISCSAETVDSTIKQTTIREVKPQKKWNTEYFDVFLLKKGFWFVSEIKSDNKHKNPN